MKKALLASLFGFAAAVTCLGQGSILFDNYDSTPYMPVTYGGGNGSLTGKGVADANVHLDLLYTIGTASSATTDLGLSVPINPTKVDSFGNAGYINSSVVVIPGYVSSPVTFQVEAWQTAGPLGGSFWTSGDRGISAAWTESSLATGLSTANNFAGLPGPNGSSLVAIVTAGPEPSLYTLSGLAGVAFLLFRRKR